MCVEFDIPGSDVRVITIDAFANPLPAITRTVAIDGCSQPDAESGAPAVELRGPGGTPTGLGIGLHLTNVDNCVIRGLRRVEASRCFAVDPGNDATLDFTSGTARAVLGDAPFATLIESDLPLAT